MKNKGWNENGDENQRSWHESKSKRNKKQNTNNKNKDEINIRMKWL